MSSLLINAEKAIVWKARIEKQKSSGLTIKKFCHEEDCNIYTFKYWKTRLEKSPERRTCNKKFIPVHVNSSDQVYDGRSRIELPNGVAVELGNDLGAGGASALIKSLCGINTATERRLT